MKLPYRSLCLWCLNPNSNLFWVVNLLWLDILWSFMGVEFYKEISLVFIKSIYIILNISKTNVMSGIINLYLFHKLFVPLICRKSCRMLYSETKLIFRKLKNYFFIHLAFFSEKRTASVHSFFTLLKQKKESFLLR